MASVLNDQCINLMLGIVIGMMLYFIFFDFFSTIDRVGDAKAKQLFQGVKAKFMR